MSELVLVEEHVGWAVVRINRPEKRNALNQQSRRELLRAFAVLSGGAKAVVLTGTDAWFCCGADVKERAKWAAEGVPDTAGPEGIELAMAIREFPGVVIAAVNGMAIGFGVNLVNCADMAVASNSATFALPELRSGSFASMSSMTTQLAGVSLKRTASLLFSAEAINAATAAEWGLLTAVVPHAELQTRAGEIASRIAGFDSAAIRETKFALQRLVPDASNWRSSMESAQGVAEQIRRAREATT